MPPRPWLDASLATEQRVDALLAAMTPAEKVGQTNQVANIDPDADADLIRAGRVSSSLCASGAHAGNERDAGVLSSAIEAAQRVAVTESRLGIPILFGRDVIHGHRTVFPIPLGLAASWAPGLAERAAAVAADGADAARRATEAGVDLDMASGVCAAPPSRPGRGPRSRRRRGERPASSPRGRDQQEGRYLDAPSLPRLPFGFGRGYATFEIGTPTTSAPTLARAGGRVDVSVAVRNTGTRAGRELVQLYLSDPVAEVTRPWVELVDWRWVELGPAASETVVFTVDAAQLGYHGRDLRHRVDPGEIVLSAGPHCQALRGVSVQVVDEEDA